MIRALVLLCACCVLLTTACTNPECGPTAIQVGDSCECPAGTVDHCDGVPCEPGEFGQVCLPVDGGMGDGGDGGGEDAGTDALACGGECDGETPHCDADTDACVACLGAEHCDTAAPVCGDDGACGPCAATSDCSSYPDTPLCDTDDGTCVACVEHRDCRSAEAARCDPSSNTCVPCTDGAECTEADAAVCDDGTCVECTSDEEAACGANSCDPTTNSCTTTERGSVTRCGACVADSECGLPGDRCVEMQFMGAPHGFYCLKQLDMGCERPFASPTSERTSRSGADAETYCGINEGVTTCEAILDLIDDTSCSAPSECGAASTEDARCETVNGIADRCTYSCTLSNQCPGGVMCGMAGNYCGAPAT